MASTSSWENLSKEKDSKLHVNVLSLKNLGSISDMSRIPAALFIVDINKERLLLLKQEN